MKTLPITMRGDVAEVLLYDEIGADDFFGGISAKQFRDQIKGIKARILNLRIDSPGGNVFEGVTMAAALREFNGRIEVDIDGVAASMASFLAMAGDEIRINEYGYLMIHNAFAKAAGTAKELRETAALLEATNSSMTDAYAKRTKADREKIAAWMEAETWFVGKQAVDAGFADSVTPGRKVAACANLKELAAKLHYKKVPDALTEQTAAAWAETERRREVAAKLVAG